MEKTLAIISAVGVIVTLVALYQFCNKTSRNTWALFAYGMMLNIPFSTVVALSDSSAVSKIGLSSEILWGLIAIFKASKK